MKNELINKTVTKNEHFFSTVMARLKDALDVANDVGLCQALGLSRSNYANKKVAGSVPFEAVVALCQEKGISIDWVFSGTGTKLTNSEHQGVIPSVEVMGCILVEVDAAIQKAIDAMPQNQSAYGKPTIHQLGVLGAAVYERIKASKFSDVKARHKAIKAHAFEIAASYQLAQLLLHIDGLAVADTLQRLKDEDAAKNKD